MQIKSSSITTNRYDARRERHREVLRIYLTSDRLLTVADLQLECASRGISYSSKSLRRILNKHFRRVSVVRGLALTPANLRARQAEAQDLLYQHDNAPSHVAVGPLALLRASDRCFEPWPPNSPDFSLIEYVWAYMQGLIGESLRSRRSAPDDLQ